MSAVAAGQPNQRYRTATQERGGAYEFGAWATYDAACLQMLRIAEEWRNMGLQVKRWGELYPSEACRNRLVGILRGKRKWTFTTEVVFDD